MTEYDFSPEAYERYTRTQQRIARWVDQTEEHRPEFGPAIAQAMQRGPSSSQRSGMDNERPGFRRGGTHSRSTSSSRSSDSSSSSGTYADAARPSRPIPTFQSVFLPQSAPHASRHMHSSSHRRSSSHRPSLSKSLRSQSYVITTPPATSPGYPYIYTNPQGTPGVVIIPPKGKVVSVTSPATSQYYPSTTSGYSPAGSGYPFPQTAYPHTAPPASSFTYPPHQPQAQPHPQAQHVYSQPSVAQAQTQAPYTQPQSQYVQATYPPTIYPLTPYTYPQPQSQNQPPPPPPIIYQIYRNGHHRKESGRRSGSSRRTH